ncbi:glucose-6-phosphate dehydrogenase [Thiotrichales bacterium 19S9-12]|nr:glucose-6-phosphate dehydrogenase [Thiotrichales bacterium 19S9-11]MCF6812348.1 glucose-6-phosphate dehydrogenase [Thiotrichales bacterium 19S9-12]
MKSENGHIITIFGASGDLTIHKLLPAIFSLYQQGLLAKSQCILGISRTKYDDQSYREFIYKELIKKYTKQEKSLKSFIKKIHYQSLDTGSSDAYSVLNDRLSVLMKSYKMKEKNILFYLATPPSLYALIPKTLAKLGLNDQKDGFKRVIIEKPFGIDEKSAAKLNAQLLKYYDESQLYRIDHYLGKETVQNLLVFRFANSIFEPLWRSEYIDNIQIYAAEKEGIGDRGGYYDKSGAMRDMVQNHLLQLLGLVAMEPPATMDGVGIRNETLKVFQSIRAYKRTKDIRNNVVVGQYAEGTQDGKKRCAYLDEDGVSKDSKTETFAAIRFFIDNWRWNNVPFYVMTGKAMTRRVSEVVINFKPTSHPYFSKYQQEDSYKNRLIIRIQPNEGIKLTFVAKEPGTGFHTHEVDMNFLYKDFSSKEIPPAYERLILDCLNGDNTLFSRNDAVEACWRIMDPIIKYYHDNLKAKVCSYKRGQWGPIEAEKMLAELGHGWRRACTSLTNDICDI